MLGVHLDVELEANCALPGLHEFGELSSAVLSLAKSFLALGSRNGEHFELLV